MSHSLILQYKNVLPFFFYTDISHFLFLYLFNCGVFLSLTNSLLASPPLILSLLPPVWWRLSKWNENLLISELQKLSPFYSPPWPIFSPSCQPRLKKKKIQKILKPTGQWQLVKFIWGKAHKTECTLQYVEKKTQKNRCATMYQHRILNPHRRAKMGNFNAKQ